MTDNETEALAWVRLLSEDRQTIAYRPVLARLTGSVLAAIFVQQVSYYWDISGGRPFYKFAAPCSHKLYRPGDSWLETLEFRRGELETAQAHSATKITQGQSLAAVIDDQLPVFDQDARRLSNAHNLVAYWTDAKRVTWYQLNGVLLGRALRITYMANGENSNRYVMSETPLVRNGGNPNTYTETTTENFAGTGGRNSVNGRGPTEAERQQDQNVEDWKPGPGQPSRGPIADALMAVCKFNYYRARLRARADFDLAVRDLTSDGRTAADLLETFAPAWTLYWRYLQGNRRPPTPREVAELYDDVVANAKTAPTGRPGKGGERETNADRIRKAAEILQ